MYAPKYGMDLIFPLFSRNSSQFNQFFDILCTKYYLTRKKKVENTDKISFTF